MNLTGNFHLMLGLAGNECGPLYMGRSPRGVYTHINTQTYTCGLMYAICSTYYNTQGNLPVQIK